MRACVLDSPCAHTSPSSCRWTDWNLLLDPTGGPNHINRTDIGAPILRAYNGSLIYQSSYFYMGHVSRWVRPGDVCVNLTSATGLLAVSPAEVDALSKYVQSNAAAEGAGNAANGDAAVPSAVIMGGAFVSADGTTATVVVMNPGPATTAFKLQDVAADGSVRATTVSLPPRSIQTLLYPL